MSTPLNPNGNPVRIGQVTLRTPGLAGAVDVHAPGTPGMRGAERATQELETALQREHVQTQQTIELTRTREVPVAQVRTRSTQFGEPAIEVEVPDPGPAFGQLVLFADESGVITWNFARDASNQIDVTRGRQTRTYVLRRQVPPATPVTAIAGGPGGATATPETEQTRGVLGAIGSKVIKVLVFPLVEPLLGAIGEAFAARWEAQHCPYRIRTFAPDTYGVVDAPDIGNADWARLGQGRALLMMHGTFSQAHSAFGSFAPEFVAGMHRAYDGRVLALDHHTMSDDPRKNIEWFLQQMPNGTKLEVDIICHSRGGLVSRTLAERAGELGAGDKGVDVRRLVFVSTPNAGTILTDTRYMGDFIDSYTNLLNFAPAGHVTDALQMIVTVAKMLAAGVVNGLDGLQSMCPTGPFLTDWLNRSGTGNNWAAREYFGLASNYEPADPGLASFAKDRLTDQLFKLENDLVVPTAGVCEVSGTALVTAERRHIYPSSRGIHHNNILGHPETQRQIATWLDFDY